MGWPLYKKHGHAYEAFRRCVASDEEAKLIFAEFGLSESVRKPGTCPILLLDHIDPARLVGPAQRLMAYG